MKGGGGWGGWQGIGTEQIAKLPVIGAPNSDRDADPQTPRSSSCRQPSQGHYQRRDQVTIAGSNHRAHAGPDRGTLVDGRFGDGRRPNHSRDAAGHCVRCVRVMTGRKRAQKPVRDLDFHLRYLCRKSFVSEYWRTVGVYPSTRPGSGVTVATHRAFVPIR